MSRHAASQEPHSFMDMFPLPYYCQTHIIFQKVIKSSITISLVEEAKGGPFVFWDGWEASCRTAKELGFDSVELFAPSAEVIKSLPIKETLTELDLSLSAVGTGGGWVKNKWQLCDSDPQKREHSIDFIKGIIEAGSVYGAPAILGSMQGRWDTVVPKPVALEYLTAALKELGKFAQECGTCFLYEPLNRYETNLFNTTGSAIEFLKQNGIENVKLLCDLFHMNIEETNVAQALEDAKEFVGHVHFVDSNRKATGLGHTDFLPIGAALKKIGYSGYASAEAFPVPDSKTAAKKTIEAFRTYLK